MSYFPLFQLCNTKGRPACWAARFLLFDSHNAAYCSVDSLARSHSHIDRVQDDGHVIGGKLVLALATPRYHLTLFRNHSTRLLRLLVGWMLALAPGSAASALIQLAS